MDSKFYDALASAVYLAKTLLPGLTDDDQRIRASGLYPEWAGRTQSLAVSRDLPCKGRLKVGHAELPGTMSGCSALS